LTGNPIQFPMAAPLQESVGARWAQWKEAARGRYIHTIWGGGFFPQPVFGVGVALGFLTWPDPKLLAFCTP